MKKKWIQPHITIQPFEPNEYVAVCWGVACSTMQANYVEQTWRLPNGGTNFDAGQNHRNHHCGTTGNQWLVDENNDGTPEVMREINTDGLGTLTCTLYTNDRGHLDADGCLHLLGRTDDVINVGGFKVSPPEVEETALSLPGVHDCVCVGVPHPVTGQQLKLLVVLDEGITLDKKSLARQLHDRLEAYKVPLLYEQVQAIRRTYNGKIDRKAYRINEK